MRAFIAIELPPAVRAELWKIGRDLAASQADVTWVKEENVHLTLRFLGEITEVQRHVVESLLQTLASRTDPIQLELSHLGAFPSMTAPRVIWVGIGQGEKETGRLAGELEGGLTRLGFAKEDRGFSAHVTLGRVRSPRNRAQLVARLKDVSWNAPQPFRADHLTLFHSTLSPAGPTYTPLAQPLFGTSSKFEA